MCNWVLTTAFLCLFSVCQASLPNCEELTKPLILEDDYKSIMGKWIFLEGIADHIFIANILKTVNSSWVEFGPSTLANTVTLSQGNMLGGKCEYKIYNATVTDSTIYVIENGMPTEGKFLPSCSDCLTMSFISKANNETINTMYLFKRGSNATESDMAMYWKQAECLGFKREPQYSYDGVTEFCHVTKENSPDQKSDSCKLDQ